MGSDTYSVRLNMLLLTEANVSELMEKKGVTITEDTDIRPLSYLLKSA